MNVVIDSNILFSALIKDSITRKLILEHKEMFLFPEIIFEEMEKYKYELVEKSKMKEKDFERLFALLLKKMQIIPTEKLEPYREKSLKIMEKIDKKDALFIACGMAYTNSVIWSEDKKLKKQNNVPIFNTKEILEYFKKEKVKEL